jgi:AbrB family looped-hinge helix DNA binding protein
MVAERKQKKTPQAPKREPVVTVAKMTSKGQITVPKFVRDHFNFKPGDEVVFVEDENGMHIRRKYKIKNLKTWQAYFADLKGRESDEILDDWRGH